MLIYNCFFFVSGKLVTSYHACHFKRIGKISKNGSLNSQSEFSRLQPTGFFSPSPSLLTIVNVDVVAATSDVVVLEINNDLVICDSAVYYPLTIYITETAKMKFKFSLKLHVSQTYQIRLYLLQLFYFSIVSFQG